MSSEKIEFWLEGGTALSTYRDKKIFEWEHDIDLGLWFTDIDKLLNALECFIKDGAKVKIQKGLPFIDNIVQLYLSDKITGENPQINQIDFYLYKKKGDYAYMRWFNSPSGKYSSALKKYYLLMKKIVLPIKHSSGKMKYLNILIPKPIRCIFFRLLFHIYYCTGKCVYHVLPAEFFLQLKPIKLYNIQFNISKNTNNYLEYRYGKGWSKPDSDFNTNFYVDKWKKIDARIELKFSILNKPDLNFSLQDFYS